jgi:poly-beta-hydroxyalkanoate depolymerase
MTLKTRSYQGIKEANEHAANIVSNFIENMEKLIEKDKTISHYAVFNSEIYRKKLEEKKEKFDIQKYSTN